MDRRGFLKAVGVGGALVVAAPQLVLARTTKVALPERRVFVPPAGGWLTWGKNESALAYVCRIPSTETVYIDVYSEPRWTLDIERYDKDGGPVPSLEGPTQIGGVEGWLVSWDQTLLTTDAVRIHERYVGYRTAPDLRTMGKIVLPLRTSSAISAQIKVDYPSERFWLP